MSPLPMRVLVVVFSSPIQVLPGHFVLMWFGASFALSCQRVWRPWRSSKSVAGKGIFRFRPLIPISP